MLFRSGVEGNIGNDGLVDERGVIVNDLTLEALSRQALVLAEAGADIVAPSDMMDGRVRAIRETLDQHQYYETSILSYAAKYASSLYAPFREAIQTSLAFGDKSTYQLNPANSKEALYEASLDCEEGADMLLVKPATFYLDIIAKIVDKVHIPVGAYHVSGEYAMIAAAAKAGILDKHKVLYESLLSIKRAGANFILSYGYEEMLEWFGH